MEAVNLPFVCRFALEVSTRDRLFTDEYWLVGRDIPGNPSKAPASGQEVLFIRPDCRFILMGSMFNNGYR